MPWDVIYRKEPRCVEVILHGTTSGDEIYQAGTNAHVHSREHDCILFLVNALDMKITASLFDILLIPMQQFIEEGMDRSSRIAVILPGTRKEQDAGRFFETASVNRGWNVRILPDRASAIEWLTTNQTARNED